MNLSELLIFDIIKNDEDTSNLNIEHQNKINYIKEQLNLAIKIYNMEYGLPNVYILISQIQFISNPKFIELFIIKNLKWNLNDFLAVLLDIGNSYYHIPKYIEYFIQYSKEEHIIEYLSKCKYKYHPHLQNNLNKFLNYLIEYFDSYKFYKLVIQHNIYYYVFNVKYYNQLINDKELYSILLLKECNLNNINIEFIKTLLKNDTDPNIYNNNLELPLISAIKNNNIELVKLLLNYKINIDDTKSKELLIALVENEFIMKIENIEIIELILNQNIKYDESINSWYQIFSIIYKKYNDINILKLFLKYYKPNLIDFSHIARHSIIKFDFLKLLLDNCENLNKSDNDNCNSIIHSIYYFKNIEFLKLFLTYDVNINIKNKKGKTVMDLTEDEKSPENKSVRELLKNYKRSRRII